MEPHDPQDTGRFLEEVFRKESDFSQIALRHIARAGSLFDRLLGRHRTHEPAIQREATRLTQFAIFLAAGRPECGSAERRTADLILRHLYGSSLRQVHKGSPDYRDDEPGEVFVRNVWDITGAPRDFEDFAACSLRIGGILRAAVDLFADVIQGFTEDANGHFASFVNAMTLDSDGRASEPGAEA